MKSRPTYKKSLATAVTEALTSLIILNVAGYERLALSIDVTVNALDQFAVKGRTHGDGTLMTLFNAGTDFTTPVGLVVDASGNLTTQAVGSGWLVLDVSGWDKIEIQAASGNAAGSVVSTYACMN